jgi:tetratricopeptide (TPR) repeat protein
LADRLQELAKIEQETQLLHDRNEREQAFLDAREALAIRIALAKKFPEDSEASKHVVLGHLLCGMLSRGDSKAESEGMASDQTAVSIAEQVVQRNPNNRDAKGLLHYARQCVLWRLIRLKRWDEARSNANACLAMAKDLTDFHTGATGSPIADPYWYEQLADDHRDLGIIENKTGNPDQAMSEYQAAVHAAEVAARELAVAVDWARLKDHYETLASMSMRRGGPRESLATWEKAAKFVHSLALRRPRPQWIYAAIEDIYREALLIAASRRATPDWWQWARGWTECVEDLWKAGPQDCAATTAVVGAYMKVAGFVLPQPWDSESPDPQDVRAALGMLERAAVFAEGGNSSLLEELALAYYWSGRYADAVRLEQEAIDVARESRAIESQSVRAERSDRLARYSKRLRTTASGTAPAGSAITSPSSAPIGPELH